uniref:Phospholipid:diacylglycerol acyltransferase n=1 Tax=Aegilops tauschii TaxID=37682 RepID=M8C502_AEGTA
MKLFSWLLHLNRLWCNDRLQRHSWENGYFCQLCLRNLESSYHLFWECPLSLQVWTQASTWKGCGALNTRNWEAAGCTTTRVQDLIRRAAPGQERKAIKSIIILITWEIQQERNGCTFRGKMACAADILGRIRLFSAVNCWLKCMLLDPYNQTDHPECKSRPDSGLSAITELDPGYITGPLSSIWKEWVKWCVDFGIEANAIIAVPYDWRLPPSMLEERDLYFHKLKLTFEIALKLRGGPSLVFAHSMGNNVFRYFLEWLKLEIAPKHYIQWLDKHIHAYFAVGAPLLGSTESVRATLSGTTSGLPITEGTARLMFNSFAASLWLLPFSKYCKADNVYWKHFFEGKAHINRQQCDEMEYSSDNSGWPTTLVSIEVPTVRGTDAYPSIMDITEDITSNMECGKPTLLSFSAREVSDGTLFKTMLDYDPQSKALIHQLEKYYQGDPVLNPLTPWERPPIKNVFCIYGIDTKTEVGYYFAPSGKPYPDNWIITDVIYEFERSLLSRQVSYNSLSWCKQWLGPKVNITRTPQAEHDGSDLQTRMNAEHHHGEDLFPNMTRAPHVKYITYYEDAESIPGWRTAVWELDKGFGYSTSPGTYYHVLL